MRNPASANFSASYGWADTACSLLEKTVTRTTYAISYFLINDAWKSRVQVLHACKRQAYAYRVLYSYKIPHPLDWFQSSNTPHQNQCRSQTGCRWKDLADSFPKTCLLVSESCWVRSNRALKIGPEGVLFCVTYGVYSGVGYVEGIKRPLTSPSTACRHCMHVRGKRMYLCMCTT